MRIFFIYLITKLSIKNLKNKDYLNSKIKELLTAILFFIVICIVKIQKFNENLNVDDNGF